MKQTITRRSSSRGPPFGFAAAAEQLACVLVAGRERHETSSSPISASGRGRRRAAGGLADRRRAKLSGAADQARGSVSAGRRLRPRRPPMGGTGETAARHGRGREPGRRRQLAGGGGGRAREARRLHASARG